MTSLLTAIFFPITCAFFIPMLPRKYKAPFSVFILVITFIATIFVTRITLNSQAVFINKYFTDWVSLSFFNDGLSSFMALVSCFVSLLIVIYSLEYMKDYEESGLFYFWMVLFLGAMMGLVFSANLILLFCFWELTSICSWRLITFYRREEDLLAADKAFLVTVFGASIMLIAMVLIFIQYGTLEVNSLRGMFLSTPIALLLFAGIISKSAQLPLQSWLPDASVAPTPVTAMLHAAVLVKIGIYVFARIFGLTFVTTIEFMNIAIAIAAATIIVSAGSALVENNIKRILAYSTISQLGYILLVLATNSQLSIQIALVYILAHSLAKAGLFLCAGIIEHKTGTKDINQLGGLLKFMPYTGLAYLFCAFSIIGIPPFFGFWPKLMTILLLVKSGHLVAGIFAVLGAVFTLFYLMRLFNRVFLGTLRIKAEEGRKSVMVWVVLIFGGLSLILGIMYKVPFDFVSRIMR